MFHNVHNFTWDVPDLTLICSWLHPTRSWLLMYSWLDMFMTWPDMFNVHDLTWCVPNSTRQVFDLTWLDFNIFLTWLYMFLTWSDIFLTKPDMLLTQPDTFMTWPDMFLTYQTCLLLNLKCSWLDLTCSRVAITCSWLDLTSLPSLQKLKTRSPCCASHSCFFEEATNETITMLITLIFKD